MEILHYDHPQRMVREVGSGRIVAEWSMMAEYVELPDGSRVPRQWRLFDFTGPESAPYYLLEFAIGDNGVPYVETVAICSSNDTREVRAVDLRNMRPLEDLLEESVDLVAGLNHPAITPASDFAAMDRERRKALRSVRRQARRRFTPETAEQVAEVYIANMEGGAPTKAVRDAFGIADSTASLYVKRARPLIDRKLKGRRRGNRR